MLALILLIILYLLAHAFADALVLAFAIAPVLIFVLALAPNCLHLCPHGLLHLCIHLRHLRDSL